MFEDAGMLHRCGRLFAMQRILIFFIGALAPFLSVDASSADAAQRLRHLAPGMQWTYEVQGSITPPGQEVPLPLAGSIEIRIEGAELDGESLLALRVSQALQPQLPVPQPGTETRPPGAAPSFLGMGDTPELTFFMIQDKTTADLYIVADTSGASGSIRRVTSGRVLFIPGHWDNDAGYSETADWDDGSQAEIYLSVEGIEIVDTPLGAFASWKAPNGSVESGGTVIQGIDWWAPELGQPSRFDAETRTTDGTIIRIHALLESTNVEL